VIQWIVWVDRSGIAVGPEKLDSVVTKSSLVDVEAVHQDGF